MEHSANKFREIFNKSPIGIIFCDNECRITDLNKKTLEILGMPSFDVFKGFRLFDYTSFRERENELLKNGMINFTDRFNFKDIRKLGLYNPTRSGTAYINWNISIIGSGYLIQIKDITEQKKQKKRLK